MGGPSNDDWLGTPAAATYLGLNQRTVYKLGRVLRFRRQDLDAYLEASRVQPGELKHLRPDTYRKSDEG